MINLNRVNSSGYKLLLTTLIFFIVVLTIQPIYLLAKAYYAQFLLQQAWQQTLIYHQNLEHKNKDTQTFHAWSWADGYPVAKLTYHTKSGDENSWVILAGMSGRNMAFAPSWLQSSAKPNSNGNTVISAHNDSHFSVFKQLTYGEFFSLTNQQGKTLKYQVNSLEITNKFNESAYEYSDNKQLTLITCYPFNSTPSPKNQRLIIKAIAI